MAIANAGSSSVSVLLGNGGGTFQPSLDVRVASPPSSVTAGDLNGDGKPDLVAVSPFDAAYTTISVLLGNGDGSFRRVKGPVVRAGVRSVVLADVNGDGKVDLISPGTNTGNNNYVAAFVFPGDGNGSFGDSVSYGSEETSLVSVADVNGDGAPDIIAVSSQNNCAWTLLGNGDGSFTEFPAYYPTRLHPRAVIAADLNGDGKPDIAIANQRSITLLPNSTR